jgi:hypothetical protein
VFGENGADKINGGADEGTATFEEPDEGQDIILVDLIDKIADGTLAPGSGHFQAGGPNAGDYVDNVGSLHKVGVYQDGGDFYDLFYYDPEDLPVEDVLDSQHISVWLYDDYDSTPTYLGSWDLMENQQVYFGVNINDHPNGVHVVVFHDEPTPEMLADPQHNWLHQQSTDLLAEIVDHDEGNTPLPTFEAGDQLIGGNGPDQFVWDAADTNNVDLIWDYNQGDGTYNPLEGDTLLLIGVTDYTTFMKDLDGDTVEDLVIYVGENQAIGLVGITDINQVTFG